MQSILRQRNSGAGKRKLESEMRGKYNCAPVSINLCIRRMASALLGTFYIFGMERIIAPSPGPVLTNVAAASVLFRLTNRLVLRVAAGDATSLTDMGRCVEALEGGRPQRGVHAAPHS